MIILPLHQEIVNYLKVHQLSKKFEKQYNIFLINKKHPSLNLELLEPKRMKIFSFRVDQKYRAIFIFRGKDIVEILDVNNHYQ
ncbi:MAG: hypothetical protein AAB693_02885 [Patescibacteria group bacterium]